MTGSELKKIKLYECPENRTRLGSRFGCDRFPQLLHAYTLRDSLSSLRALPMQTLLLTVAHPMFEL